MIFWFIVITFVIVALILYYCHVYCGAKVKKWYHLPYSQREKTMEETEKKLWYKVHSTWSDNHPIYYIIWGLFWVLLIIFVIMSIIAFCIYGSARGEEAALYQEREALIYQLENDIYNDNGDDVVGKKELYNQISEWNQHLATAKIYVTDFWFGIFWPDFYEDIEYIQLK